MEQGSHMVYRTEELKYETALDASTWQFKASDLMLMKAEFQRPVDRGRVAKIVRQWDIRLFEQPTVFILPDDTCVLGEGQHRVAAFVEKMGGDIFVTCRVITTDRPGMMFVTMSGSKRRVEQIHVFKALVADGEPNAVGAKNTAEKHGFTISNAGSTHSIAAAKTLVDLYAMDRKALDAALFVIAIVMTKRGDEDRGWLKSSVIKTVWHVVRNFDVDLRSLANKMAKKSADTLVPYSVNDLRRNAEELIGAYNSGRRDHNRLKPNELKYPDRSWR
jgi:hypothetical protein